MAADPHTGPGEVDPIGRLLLKLRARDLVSDEEAAVLRSTIDDVKQMPAGRPLVRANTTLSHSILLIDGLASRYKDLADGERQIMELHVAGDYVDLHGFLLKRLDHHVGALTDVTIATAPHDRLRRLTEEQPHLARMLWFSTLTDSSIQREKILSVGRRDALSRVAHLLCELFIRLEVVGLAADFRFQLPLTQLDLADATGLTSVHVNRMLKRLRDDQLLTFRGGEVVIHDWDRLQRAGEFDPSYLYLERRPR